MAHERQINSGSFFAHQSNPRDVVFCRTFRGSVVLVACLMLLTVGHSTHAWETFLTLLRAHDISAIADVRSIPRSRRHPHFSQDALELSLPAAGIAYRHIRELGGHRKPQLDTLNGAWRNVSFRGYADYMQSPSFDDALNTLLAWERENDRRMAIMCAESVWWRCHRQLIADALVARGYPVWHVTGLLAPTPHQLTEFGVVRDVKVTYPLM